MIYIKDLENSVTKQFKVQTGTSNIFFAGMKNIILVAPKSVTLFDTELKSNFAEISAFGVKQVIWSNDMTMVALLSKHLVIIANKKLEQVAQIHETIKVKSGAWDDSGVFIYTTLNHIKYTLPQGFVSFILQ